MYNIFFKQGLVAGTLCKFSQYDGWIPVNKNLWYAIFIFDYRNICQSNIYRAVFIVNDKKTYFY